MDRFTQYLKDTRAELNHVAWPSQMQTIVYTALVVLISLFVALYIGFFDFLFTTSLKRFVENKQTSATTPAVTITPVATGTTVVKTSPSGVPVYSTSTNFK